MKAVTLSAGNAEDRVSGRFSVKELVKVSFDCVIMGAPFLEILVFQSL